MSRQIFKSGSLLLSSMTNSVDIKESLEPMRSTRVPADAGATWSNHNRMPATTTALANVTALRTKDTANRLASVIDNARNILRKCKLTVSQFITNQAPNSRILTSKDEAQKLPFSAHCNTKACRQKCNSCQGPL